MQGIRGSLPKPSERLPLGTSGLTVSPLCIGMTQEPDTILHAYEAGVNFFFISADLHWPLYEATRSGIRKLLVGNTSRRDEIVVGVVSYLDEPLFRALQFDEVLAAVPGLERVDLLIAGAISGDHSFKRLKSLHQARARRHLGSRSIGATFHERRYVLLSEQDKGIDINYIRYNTAHPGAQTDLFPYLSPNRTSLTFNFKSTTFYVPEERFLSLSLPRSSWLPNICDHYRFVLSNPYVDGILCSPLTVEELKGLIQSLNGRTLSVPEQTYMMQLSTKVFGAVP